MDAMSVISGTTSSSILKGSGISSRERAKSTIVKEVRFETHEDRRVRYVLEQVLEYGNIQQYEKFLSFITSEQIQDDELLNTLRESRECIHKLDFNFRAYIETLLNMRWQSKNEEVINEYKLFMVDLIVAQNRFASMVMGKLVSQLIPKESDKDCWQKGNIDDSNQMEMQQVRNLLSHLIKIVPMTTSLFLREISEQFPFYKQPSFVINGYIYNLLTMIEQSNSFCDEVLTLLLLKLLEIDVNISKFDIEDAEYGELIDEDIDSEQFTINDVRLEYDPDEMKHPVAETLDVGMCKIFHYIKRVFQSSDKQRIDRLCSNIFSIFQSDLLPTHKSHHVQFTIFYLCTFHVTISEIFIQKLWQTVCNFNLAPTLRQAAIGYLASLLARARFVPMSILQDILKSLTTWAHQYIQRADGVNNSSLKSHLVFYSICQAVFYVIAFRSKELTKDSDGLLFLQSLQLSTLVTCQLNPLRVCLPAIATTFAGVTRAHQLAYCHTVLERNARRKLATIYTNESQMPDEFLDTFFPFDPYLLKKSGKYIEPYYLHYQGHEVDEEEKLVNAKVPEVSPIRKRTVSMVEDGDEFMSIDRQKRLKLITQSLEEDIKPAISPRIKRTL